MWKNGKEGNTEGRRIMEGKDGRWKMEDGRRLKRKKKTEPRKRGEMRQAREGERQERRWENRVGGNKIIAAWLRRCGIK